MKHALGATWSIFIHWNVPGRDNISADLHKGRQPGDDSR
jgi:hypothetical protein